MRIIDTTDKKFLGTVIEELPLEGEELILGDSKIEVDKITVIDEITIISNPNYIIKLIEE